MYQPLTLPDTEGTRAGHFVRLGGQRVDVTVTPASPDAYAVTTGGVLAGFVFAKGAGRWGIRYHGPDGTCSRATLARIPSGYDLHATLAAAVERVATEHLNVVARAGATYADAS